MSINQFSGNPQPKETTKPIYIVTVQEADKEVFIKTRQDLFNIYPTHMDIRGTIISKTQANKLKKSDQLDRSFGDRKDQVNLLIPLHNFVKAENISFDGIAERKK